MEIAHNYMGPGATKAMQRINENGNVVGTIIVNCEGFPETTTLDSLTAATYSTHMRNLSHHASNALKEILGSHIPALLLPKKPILIGGSIGIAISRQNCSHITSVPTMDVTDELVVLRLVSRKTEAVVVPDHEFHLIVVMRR